MTAVVDFREVVEKRFWLNDFRTTEITSHARPFGHEPKPRSSLEAGVLSAATNNDPAARKSKSATTFL
jgi:hypothetical protein